MIFRVPSTGVLHLGWDNSLSIRKYKEIDVFVKRFNVPIIISHYVQADVADQVMTAEMKRQEAWRQGEKRDLTEGNMEGGQLTLKLTERVMTADGVKYTCHCDWENCVDSRGFVICSESRN